MIGNLGIFFLAAFLKYLAVLLFGYIDKSIISQKINNLKLKPTHKIQLFQYLFFYYQFFDYWK